MNDVFYRRSNNGFTLFELMVVICILGLVVGLATFVNQFSPEKFMDREIDRLLILLNHAQEQSVVQGKIVGFYLDSTQYEFKIYNGESKSWIVINDKPLAARSFDEEITIELKVADSNSAKSSEKNDEDVVFFFPNGESTPFKLLFYTNQTGVKSQSFLYNDGISGIKKTLIHNDSYEKIP